MTENVCVTKVPVDKVAFHTHNVRRDLGDLRPLANSIRRFGVMQPIVVEDYGDTLRLRAGHRRLAAARMAGLTRVPALVHDKALDDDEWLVHSVQENVMRRGLDKEERRRAIQALLDLGCTWDGIADAFGVEKATAQGWVREPRTTKVPANPAVRSRAGKPNYGRSIRATTVRTFVDRWSEEAQHRDVSAEEVLDSLAALATQGRLQDALPDELATRRRTA